MASAGRQSIRGAGVVLAAGASTRMGTCKALLTLPDGRTFVAAWCAALREAGASPVFVIVRGQSAPIGTVLRGSPVRLVRNNQLSLGQVRSCALGLEAAEREHCAFALIAPVDRPPVSVGVLRGLAAAAREEPGAVHVPVFHGGRGHPAAFPCGLAPELRLARPGEGARDVVMRLGVRIVEHQVDDEGVVLDLDTPEDLSRWRARLSEEVRR